MNKAGVIFIAGPTASGKSAAAIALAREIGGEIVNADAMQVYADLRILTARPSLEDEAQAPHHLYGVMDGAARCSAGRWAERAADWIEDINGRGAAAIVVGGTGLYFRALEEGLSPIPEILPNVRAAGMARYRELGAAAFHREVILRDPDMAHLPEGDTQRLVRAWEVFEATGKPLSYFQNLPREPLVKNITAKIVIEPERLMLYHRTNQRAQEMMSDGAIEEVRALLARDLDRQLPVMKALGVDIIRHLLNGSEDASRALDGLQMETRRFAKRQLTWFRNQAADWPRAETAEDAVPLLLSIIENASPHD